MRVAKNVNVLAMNGSYLFIVSCCCYRSRDQRLRDTKKNMINKLRVRGNSTKNSTSIIHKIFNVSFDINPIDADHTSISSLQLKRGYCFFPSILVLAA